MANPPLTRLAVVGTGLIGTSVGLAAKRAGIEVAAFDADAAALAAAVERGAVDAGAGTVAEAVAEADLVVVAVPVGAIPACASGVLAATGDGTTVTDVGSTKVGICSALAGEPRFVGGHPLAGSEQRGPEAARADLFDGSTWLLTPTESIDPARVRAVRELVGSLGAEAVELDPAVHDRVVALVSHLPHALANLLVNQVAADAVGRDALATAAPSFADLTRVAGANPDVWVDIFLANADVLGPVLTEHRRLVSELEDRLGQRDSAALARWIEDAARNRPT